MPNVVGMWNPALSEESIRETLAKQLHRVRIAKGSYKEYTYVSPGFGMGLQDHGILENGPQPVLSEDGRMVLLLDGELYNAGELQRRFRNELPSHELSSPELCLHLLMQHGEEIAHVLNGLFGLVLYDRSTHRLTLISDHFGFRPLFYVQRSQAFVFGSELKALCAVDPDTPHIDDVATFEYFCYGSYIMDRTWIQGYLRLPPATILTVDEHGIHSRPYWVYHYDESAPTLDQPTYSTLFSTLFDRAVERCMQGSKRIGIFLSGGYDSRAVAAAIRQHHLPIPAFTFGHPQARDVRYAAMLAARLGLDHHPLAGQGPYLYRNCPAIVWRTEGLCSFANTTSIQHHTLLKEYMDIILLGFLAEFSGSHTWPQLLLTRSRQAAINTIFSRMIGDRLGVQRRIFNSTFFAHAFEALHTRFEASFENIPNDHPMDMADCWNMTYLQPRSTSQTPSVDRHLFEARAPHMDFELVNFLLTIPPYARLEQRVYKRMIAQSFPNIRDIPCTNSGLPINPHFVREYLMMSLRYVGRKSTEAFKKSFRIHSPLVREFRDLNEDFRAEPAVISDILQPLLRDSIFPTHMFNHAGIQDVIDDHYKKNAPHHATLSMLISWGLAVKYLLHNDFSTVPPDMYTS